jgi:hypothetical protein
MKKLKPQILQLEKAVNRLEEAADAIYKLVKEKFLKEVREVYRRAQNIQ